MLIGKNASGGIAYGPAMVLKPIIIKIENEPATDVDFECQRFQHTLVAAKADINKLYEKVKTSVGEEEAQIFEAHSMLLDDPELIDTVESFIRTNRWKASKAIDEAAKQFIKMFESMDNAYMRERALDIKDVTERLLKKVLGLNFQDLSNLESDVILVAHDITPSQFASLEHAKVKAIVTEIGGKTSHTAIMARTLEIPAVVGMKEATLKIKNGENIIVDGDTGHIETKPNAQSLKEYEAKKIVLKEVKEALEKIKNVPVQTKDGFSLHLEANITSAADVPAALKNQAQGVGLFRTEFIFMDRSSAPTEDEQTEIYKTVLEKMEGRPTVIRTLDIGGDKNLPYLGIPKEENPFLGYRAVRYCLNNIPLFKTQLRALLKASTAGKLGIMFPMITNLEEIIACRKLLEECRTELVNEKVTVAQDIRIGIMIEVPAAALIADLLAKHVDFFSIGTNDLTQYVCAVDRMNENVHDLYDSYHPGFLRLTKFVIESANKAGIEICMCGEVASDPKLTEVLVGMGLTHFSMNPASILKIKDRILKINKNEAKIKAEKVVTLSTGDEIRNFLNS